MGRRGANFFELVMDCDLSEGGTVLRKSPYKVLGHKGQVVELEEVDTHKLRSAHVSQLARFKTSEDAKEDGVAAQYTMKLMLGLLHQKVGFYTWLMAYFCAYDSASRPSGTSGW